jgi:hypothetical protein
VSVAPDVMGDQPDLFGIVELATQPAADDNPPGGDPCAGGMADSFTRSSQRLYLGVLLEWIDRYGRAGDSHRLQCARDNAAAVLRQLRGLGGWW